jgi:hypothetical protein
MHYLQRPSSLVCGLPVSNRPIPGIPPFPHMVTPIVQELNDPMNDEVMRLFMSTPLECSFVPFVSVIAELVNQHSWS